MAAKQDDRLASLGGARLKGTRGTPAWPLTSYDEPADRLFLPACLVFAAGWLLFAWPWLSGRVVIPWDAKAHFLPQVQFLAASLARGEWPFWTPNVFAGHPQIADPQSQIFSPPMLLLAMLNPAPGSHAADVTVFLCLLGAGLGIIWLFREFGWHSAGGLVAAFGFSFGAAMAWRIQHYGQLLSLAYLPFALIFLKRALERRSIGYGFAAGVMSGFIVCGRDQVALLVIYLLAAWAITWLLTRPERLCALRAGLAPLAAGAVGGIVVSLVPVVLTALLATQSNRPEIDFVGAGRGSLHPALLLTAVAPHLYGAAGPMADFWGPPSFAWTGTDLFTAQNVGQSYIGALPVMLLLAGIFRGYLWAPGIRFFSAAFLVSLFYALGWYTPFFRAAYELLPGVSLYRRPADAVFLLGALGSILAGYVLHRWLNEPGGERTNAAAAAAVAGSVVGLIALCLIVAWRLDRIVAASAPLLATLATFTLVAALAAGAASLRHIRPIAALAAVGFVMAADLAWNNGPNGATGLPAAMAMDPPAPGQPTCQGTPPPSMFEMLEPTTSNETIATLKRLVAQSRSETRRDRIELAGLGFNWPNASLTHGLENTLGYNPVRLGIYSAATGAEDHVGLPDQRKFSALFPSYRSRLADMLGLRYIATGAPIEAIDKTLPPNAFKLIARTREACIYENPNALPRVLFARRSVPYDLDRLIGTGRWPDVDPLDTVLIDETVGLGSPAPQAGLPPLRAPGTVKILSYRNTEVVIAADSPQGGWVVLNDAWHPRWEVEVDGKPIGTAMRANAIFRAAPVPPGKLTVRFVFRPLSGGWRTPERKWSLPDGISADTRRASR